MFKNYHIDGNKEMIAFGTMNIVGSLTSCYLTTGMSHLNILLWLSIYYLILRS
jgi:MFS superfamily sulfate permease-like transporter